MLAPAPWQSELCPISSPMGDGLECPADIAWVASLETPRVQTQNACTNTAVWNSYLFLGKVSWVRSQVKEHLLL